MDVERREQAGDGVGEDEQPVPDAPPGPGLHQRGVNERRRGEAHADAEELAPPLGGEAVREVVEREDVEVPQDRVEGHPCEDTQSPVPDASAQDEQADDRIGDRRDQRDQPRMLHGYTALSGLPGRVSRRGRAYPGVPASGS